MGSGSVQDCANARILKGMKLSEVADGVSVSESFISKLENDKVQPSLAVLHKLVAFLGVNVSSLFGDLTEGQSTLFVMRAGGAACNTNKPSASNRRCQYRSNCTPFTKITASSKYSCSCARWLRPWPDRSHRRGDRICTRGSSRPDGWKGTCRISAGDSFFFSSEHQHGYVNPGSTIARIVWVNTPATF